MIFTINQNPEGAASPTIEVVSLKEGVRIWVGNDEKDGCSAFITLPYEKVSLLCGVLTQFCSYKKEVSNGANKNN